MVIRKTPRRGRLALIVAGAAAVVTAGTTAVHALTASDSPPASFSFFATADTSPAVLDPDTQPVELGLRMRTSVAGTIDAVRFLKAPGDNGPHRVSVWSQGGRRLASAMSTDESGSGWQQVKLPDPVAVRANRTYVVSYHTTRYMATTGFFAAPVTAGPMSASTSVYAYGSDSFPTQSYLASNYWVDLVFTTSQAPGQPPSPKPSVTTSPTVTQPPPGTPTPTGSPSNPTGGPLPLPRVPWEGGPGYYDQFASTRPWNNQNFFPVGVWFESVLTKDDTARDKAAGLNTYVELTSNSSSALVREAGMWAMTSNLRSQGAESVAHLLTDEPDMIYGAGSDPWTGRHGWNTCTPIQDQGGKCGYTVMQALSDQAPKDGKPRYNNYGKGVMMWQSDREAEVFVNRYQQIVSADMYFYTDNNLCVGGEAQRFLNIPQQFCRRSSSYGIVMDRMRKLDGMDGKRQPVWAFVEVGHPFSEGHWPTINGDQITGAVMNSIIHEARGIIYFNHNFGGPCQSQHVLRDGCGAAIRPAVTEVNRRIASLAPVLNTQSYQFSLNPSLDTMLKAHGGSFYVFAMPGRAGGTGTQTLTLPPGISASRAEVMFENRTVAITGGQFTDSFPQESSYHIYKITP